MCFTCVSLIRDQLNQRARRTIWTFPAFKAQLKHPNSCRPRRIITTPRTADRAAFSGTTREDFSARCIASSSAKTLTLPQAGVTSAAPRGFCCGAADQTHANIVVAAQGLGGKAPISHATVRNSSLCDSRCRVRGPVCLLLRRLPPLLHNCTSVYRVFFYYYLCM